MHVLTRSDNYDPARGALSSYLCGVARNFVRRQAARTWDALPEAPDDDADTLCPAAWIDSVTPADRLLQREDSERLRRAILRLPPHYRDALVLCALQDYSYAEAAAICGCELGTIRSRLARARALLAQALTGTEAGAETMATRLTMDGETENSLTQALAQLREDIARLDAPAELEARLRAAFAQRRRSREQVWQRPGAVLAMPIALAAAIVAVSWILRTPASSVDPIGRIGASMSSATQPERSELGTAFFPLVPLREIAQNVDTRVIAVSFPRTALASFGLPIDPARAAEPVNGEMLVASNGAPLAVRFITLTQ